MDEEEEDLHPCQQCAMLRESLQPCEGDCGREICSYCGPKCQECADRDTIEEIKLEKREKKRKKEEAEKKGFQPERSLAEKVERAMDWVFGFADGALRRELEYYEGEFENYEFDDIQEMMRARWKHLPDWKKRTYKIKKKGEDMAIKTALKAGTIFERVIESTRKHGR